MNGYELQRYLQDERVREALQARAHRERAETVHRLAAGALRRLVRATCAAIERLAGGLAAQRASPRLRGCGCPQG